LTVDSEIVDIEDLDLKCRREYPRIKTTTEIHLSWIFQLVKAVICGERKHDEVIRRFAVALPSLNLFIGTDTSD